jgi:hypothetical protein
MFTIPIGELINIWFLYMWSWLPAHLACARARGSAFMLGAVLVVSLGGWLGLALGSALFLQDALRSASEHATMIAGIASTLLQLVVGAWLSWDQPAPLPAGPTKSQATERPASPWSVTFMRGSFSCA